MSTSTDSCKAFKREAMAKALMYKVQEFSLVHIVQTGSVAHSASYPVGTGVKAAEA
jgi:hypothetical protein